MLDEPTSLCDAQLSKLMGIALSFLSDTAFEEAVLADRIGGPPWRRDFACTADAWHNDSLEAFKRNI